MKILMTGAEGMLGSTMWPVLHNQGHTVIRTDLVTNDPIVEKLDVRDHNAVSIAVSRHRPDAVFHLAAETDVDLCEQQMNHAFHTNALGTENVALACKRNDVLMVYISTIGVFWGDKIEPYNEFDTPRPKNWYGQSKLEGEKFVRRLLDRYFILRAGWMVGGFERDKKFVKKILDQIQSGQTELRVVSDKSGTPTFTIDFANNIMDVVATHRYGLYHMGNTGICTRYDIAKRMVELLGKEHSVHIHPISSGEFPLPAPRADSERMNNAKLTMIGLNKMPPWQDSLAKYIDGWKSILRSQTD